MTNRTVEVFSAGCQCCDDAVRLVRDIACDSCDVQVHDMRDTAVQAKARQYGINRVPAVLVNGKLSECCQQNAVDADTLRSLGLGSAA